MAEEAQDVNIPAAKSAVVGEFDDRPAAERAIGALLDAGFTDDHLNLVARGAHGEPSGEFVPGALIVTARSTGRGADAERILAELGAKNVHRDEVSATGELDETREVGAGRSA